MSKASSTALNFFSQPDLSMEWEKLAIELEEDFAKFVENETTREDLWRSLDEGKRLSKSEP